jgi:hypothetical protein
LDVCCSDNLGFLLLPFRILLLLIFASISLLAALTKHCRLRLKCNGTRTETRFCLSAKWTNPFKLAGPSVQLTTGSRGVCISGSNAGYTMFCAIVKGTGYSLHLPVSPSLPLPCVTVCHHISTGLLYILLSISMGKVSWCTVNLEGMYLVSYCEMGAGSCTKMHRIKLLYIVKHETQPGSCCQFRLSGETGLMH